MGRVKWKIDVRLAILCCGLPALGCDLPHPSADQPALTPAQLIEAGHDLLAKAALTPVVEAEPSNANAAWLLSKALSGLNSPEAALVYAERAVALDADNAAYQVQLGAVLGRLAEKASMFKQLGLARRTRKALETGVALDPRNLDGLYGLMLYYFSAPSFMAGDKAKAGDLAARMTAIDPVRGFMARASLAHESKDAAQELDFRRRAVEADPGNFDAQSELAQYYLDLPQRDYSALETSACKLLEIAPDRPDGWRVMAEIHVASHCWTELDEVLQLSEQFNHEDLSPYYAAAAAMVRLEERLPAARTYLEKYLSQPADGGEPSHAMARWQLATLLEKDQHTGEAVAQLELALQQEPGLEAAKKDLKRLKGK